MKIKHYIEILEKIYSDYSESSPGGMSVSEFIGDVIFDFITYDSELSEEYAINMMEVLDVILTEKNFEYIGENDQNYRKYIQMINTHFLHNRAEWGTSIRGAWLSFDDKTSINFSSVQIPAQDCKFFLKVLIAWYRKIIRNENKSK